MSVIGQTADWMIEAVNQLWSAATTSWGIVGLAIIGVPLTKKIFKLFITFLRGAF